MESKYSPQRTRNLFQTTDIKPYKISRSKIENFLTCKRCFYLDRKCGTAQPPMYPYTLNNAIDKLLKKEFDVYRAQQQKHPYFIKNNIDAIPFDHPDMQNWRMNQRGIQYLHEPTNLLITGAVDDIWVNENNEKILIVDYKATSNSKAPSLEGRDSYKRQMEIYQWLFRKNGFQVSDTGYFVYCSGDTKREEFKGTLHFDTSLLSHQGNDSWVEQILFEIKDCLMSDKLPEPTENCSYWLVVIGRLLKFMLISIMQIKFIDFFCSKDIGYKMAYLNATNPLTLILKNGSWLIFFDTFLLIL
jgi:CRISPR/Cas system-associated exonuclease Cas4 (RecB family)